MIGSTRELGARGEEVAREYLEKQGFKLLGQNIRVGHDEIDLLAEDSENLLFVEIKTRTASQGSYGRPSRAVDAKKRERLLRSASEYLRRNPASRPPRLDVIEVIFPIVHRDTPISPSRLIPLSVKHIKGAVRLVK